MIESPIAIKKLNVVVVQSDILYSVTGDKRHIPRVTATQIAHLDPDRGFPAAGLMVFIVDYFVKISV